MLPAVVHLHYVPCYTPPCPMLYYTMSHAVLHRVPCSTTPCSMLTLVFCAAAFVRTCGSTSFQPKSGYFPESGSEFRRISGFRQI